MSSQQPQDDAITTGDAGGSAPSCGYPRPYYQRDGITIYHGDALEILPLISFDAFVADPPYGIAKTNGGPSSRSGTKGNYESAFEDTQEYVSDVCASVIRMAIKQSRKGRGAVTCGRTNMWHYPPARDVGALVSPRAVGVSYWGRPTWQPVLFYGNAANAGEQLRPLHRLMMNAAPKNGHPCPKPIESWRWVVGKSSKEGETVCDPFMGSGTTLVAAKLDGRGAIGIEIEERYCEIAAKRLSQGVLF
jgi:DNA modification methylase